MSDENKQTSLLLEMWSKCVDVQVHYATLSSRTRQLGLVVVTASMLVAAIAIGAGWSVAVPLGGRDFQLHGAVLALVAPVAALLVLRALDLQVHDRMLRGAMSFGEELEREHLRPELVTKVERGMTEAISAALSSDARGEQVRRFYGVTAAVPAVAGLVLLVATNARVSKVDAAPVALAAAVIEPAQVAEPEPTPAVVTETATAPAPAPVTAAAAHVPATAKPGAKAATIARGKPAAATPAATAPAAEAAPPAASPAAAAPAESAPAPAAAEPPKPEPKPEPRPEPRPEPAPEPAAAAAAEPAAEPAATP